MDINIPEEEYLELKRNKRELKEIIHNSKKVLVKSHIDYNLKPFDYLFVNDSDAMSAMLEAVSEWTRKQEELRRKSIKKLESHIEVLETKIKNLERK